MTDGYSVRVYSAYRKLAEQYQSPEVRIDALHGQVGGSLQDLHQWLRNAWRAQCCVPCVGEPTAVGDAARQSALRLSGERETFLRVKLLEPTAAIQRAEIAAGVGAFQVVVAPMADNPQPRIAINVTASQARLLAEAIQHGSQQQAELQALQEELRAFADRPHEYVQEHKPNELERYEQLLRATAKVRHPERTPELEARIEKTVQKRLGEFHQEQQLRAYEARLRRTVAEKHPTLTAKEAEHYERRIKELLASRREALARKQQPQQPARQQEQGRAIEG
jgi:hypothetical protein